VASAQLPAGLNSGAYGERAVVPAGVAAGATPAEVDAMLTHLALRNVRAHGRPVPCDQLYASDDGRSASGKLSERSGIRQAGGRRVGGFRRNRPLRNNFGRGNVAWGASAIAGS